MVSDNYAQVAKGDFGLWNELAAHGHEVMPHGYRHADKIAMPFDEAQELILRCLDVFDQKLQGFDRRRAVFNFPYNRTTPELEAWLPTVVRAFRGGFAESGINAMPSAQTRAIRTTGSGRQLRIASRCVHRSPAGPAGRVAGLQHPRIG